MGDHQRHDPLSQTVPQATAVLASAKDTPARAALLVRSIEGVRVVALQPGRRLVIGRDPSAGLCVDDAGLSRRHARFSESNGEVFVEDLGSTNGTRYQGARLQAPQRLLSGDEVGLGPVTVTLHLPAEWWGPGQRREALWLSHDRLRERLELEVERCRAFKRPLGVLMLSAGTLVDGSSSLAGARELLHPLDVVARHDPASLEVLLLERDLDGARAVAEALLEAGAAERCGVATFPESGGSADELLQRARQALRSASAEGPLHCADRSAGQSEPLATSPDAPVVVSEAMRRIHETVARLAGTVVPVLLLGETGTGKEVLARAIHGADERSGRRLISVNCGAIPETLLESVLFGHEKGAFTGAEGARPGLFEDADGGTLFLDEVGELSASAQAALLRVLETRRVTRVGSHQERSVDVRVVAATHRDLEDMAARGAFRSDLLYRINTMALILPPLRERGEEIEPLAQRFLAEASAVNRCAVTGIAPEASRLLSGYGWPGNVRELRNVIERAVILTGEGILEAAALPTRIRAPDAEAEPIQGVSLESAPTSVSGAAPSLEGITDLRAELRRHETALILAALEGASGNRKEAAARLGLPLRTLSHKMGQLGIRRGGYGAERG